MADVEAKVKEIIITLRRKGSWLMNLVANPLDALRQLLPLTYRTYYTEAGQRHYVVWRMWFGRCFQVSDVRVAR